jgi:hypothetical protein
MAGIVVIAEIVEVKRAQPVSVEQFGVGQATPGATRSIPAAPEQINGCLKQWPDEPGNAGAAQGWMACDAPF